MAFKALNHFVPRLYLKRFSADGVHVLEYRTLVRNIKVPKWNAVATRKLTALKHLYTSVQRGSDGELLRSDGLEEQFDRDFETPAAEAIDRAINGEAMRREHWRHLARFFALQQLRTPLNYAKSRDAWHQQMEGTVKYLTDLLKSVAPGGPTPAILRQVETQFTEESGIPLMIEDVSVPGENKVRLHFHTSIGRRAWLQDIKRQLSRGEPIEALESNKWTILRPAPGSIFISSDRPAANLRKNCANHWEWGAGWQESGAVLYMPLSPSTLLFTEPGARRIQRDSELTSIKVREVNQTIAVGAMRSIFSIREVPEVETYRPRRVDESQARKEEQELLAWDDLQTPSDLSPKILDLRYPLHFTHTWNLAHVHREFVQVA